MTRDDDRSQARDVGLCRTCANVQVITSARQSTFYLCRLSATDPRFPKYPPLPVRACDGYVKADSPPGD
ncbi:MAG TPA: hypothetical protein VH436_15055 [Vicinamibacterales bacterium]